MLRKTITIASLGIVPLVLGVTCVFGQSLQKEIALSVFIQTYITQGDSAYHKFANEEALGHYQKALDLNPGDYHILWRISRIQVEIGEHQPKDVQLPHYEEALHFAEQAILANPEGWEGFTYRSISNGKIALFKGVWKSIGVAKQIKKDCEKAIEINPDNHIAMYVLARTHHKVAEKGKIFRIPLGLGWASNRKAKELYEAALFLRPNLVVFSIDYARLLIKMKRYEEAREVLLRISDMPIVDQDDEWNKGNAERLLEGIKYK